MPVDSKDAFTVGRAGRESHRQFATAACVVLRFSTVRQRVRRAPRYGAALHGDAARSGRPAGPWRPLCRHLSLPATAQGVESARYAGRARARASTSWTAWQASPTRSRLTGSDSIAAAPCPPRGGRGTRGYPVNCGLDSRLTLTTALAFAMGRSALPLTGAGEPAAPGGTGDGADPVGTSALAPLVTVAALTLARSRKVARNVLC